MSRPKDLLWGQKVVELFHYPALTHMAHSEGKPQPPMTMAVPSHSSTENWLNLLLERTAELNTRLQKVENGDRCTGLDDLNHRVEALASMVKIAGRGVVIVTQDFNELLKEKLTELQGQMQEQVDAVEENRVASARKLHQRVNLLTGEVRGNYAATDERLNSLLNRVTALEAAAHNHDNPYRLATPERPVMPPASHAFPVVGKSCPRCGRTAQAHNIFVSPHGVAIKCDHCNLSVRASDFKGALLLWNAACLGWERARV